MDHPLSRYAGLIGVAAFALIWELAARLIWRDPAVLPAPSDAIMQALTLMQPGELLGHIGISLGRILAGFALAAAAGVLLGIAAGWFSWFGMILRPLIELLRPIPPLAWIPLAIIWFGLGEPSKVFVIFLGAFFPVFTNAYRGITMIPPVIFRAARTMDI
ncbi:MAG: ABC transporter permease, partial [Proteobacteria bacterium]|nr:ABC transporter permease [Pseudomonadota bacterium]